jgi:hypothetical protein
MYLIFSTTQTKLIIRDYKKTQVIDLTVNVIPNAMAAFRHKQLKKLSDAEYKLTLPAQGKDVQQNSSCTEMLIS